MYAGVGSQINSPNAESHDIPEWKRLLIMKKRAATSTSEENTTNIEQTTRSRGPIPTTESGCCLAPAGDGGCDSLSPGQPSKFPSVKCVVDSVENDKATDNPPETVIRTIGSIKIELRSVYKSQENGIDEDRPGIDRFLTSPLSEPTYPDSEEEEDLPYGPGIVDKLRSKFLNLGQKSKRKPVVRKFSSLENLSGGMFRATGLQARGEKKFLGRMTTSNNSNQRVFPSCNFKKAQSMETLLVGGSDSSAFTNRRSNARIFQSRNRNEKTPSRLDSKLINRFERQVAGPNINENELPRPDTVRHVKRIFESPQTNDKTCHVATNQAIYEKGPYNRVTVISGTSSSASKSLCSATSGTATVGDLILEDEEPQSPVDDDSAKENDETIVSASDELGECHNSDGLSLEVDTQSPLSSPKQINSPEINGHQSPVISHLTLDLKSLFTADVNSAKTFDVLSEDSPEIEEYPVVKVNPEQLPLLIESPTSSSSSDVESSQGSQVFDEPDRIQDKNHCVIQRPHLEEDGDCSSSLAEMVIACSGEDSARHPDTAELLKQTLKKPNWQKPPPPTTSIVFDFRGKDVKPQISLGPAPFGCKPAKVKKRAGSPPRGGGDSPTVNGDHSSEDEDEDEEDWDEMDIGADLPMISGIVFTGENVKVGKGSLLERRNKKLTIQFNDDATSTFEYPCEATPPFEENGFDDNVDYDSNLRPVKSSFAITNAANTALSNYTPHALNSSEVFQLGVVPPPPPIHRRIIQPSIDNSTEDDPPSEELIPAEDSSGWSSTESADILF